MSEQNSFAARCVRHRLEDLNEGDSIIVYDLEYTAWEGSLARKWSGPGEYRELVQLGAVKLSNRPGFPEMEYFDQMALPEFNPVLSAYFTALTGITNADLAAAGRPFAAVMTDFRAFIGSAALVAANGDDSRCLAENCGWRGVDMPADDGRWLNLRPLFMTELGLPTAETVSSELPGLMGFSMPGTAHTGLADARAIAEALRVIWRKEEHH